MAEGWRKHGGCVYLFPVDECDRSSVGALLLI